MYSPSPGMYPDRMTAVAATFIGNVLLISPDKGSQQEMLCCNKVQDLHGDGTVSQQHSFCVRQQDQLGHWDGLTHVTSGCV